MVTSNTATSSRSRQFGGKLAIVIVAAFVVFMAAVVAGGIIISRGHDLTIADTAIEFETAVQGRNYEAMWDLSAGDYRQGFTRDEFIAWARLNTPEPKLIYEWTALNETDGDIGRVHTYFQLSNGDIVTNRMMLNRIDSEWKVISYEPYDGPWPPVEPALNGS